MNSLKSIFAVRATNRLFRSIVKLLTATAFPIICVRRCATVLFFFFKRHSFLLPISFQFSLGIIFERFNLKKKKIYTRGVPSFNYLQER